MEKIIVVEKSEILQGAKGDYLKVTDKEGKSQNIFDQALWNLFGDGLAVKLTLEKQGRWWNVTGAEAVKDVLAKKAVEKVGDNQITEKNKSVALSYSKDLVVAGKIELRDITSYADKFLAYILKKEVLPVKSHLVEEVKKTSEGKE